jgi:hypothetical protein
MLTVAARFERLHACAAGNREHGIAVLRAHLRRRTTRFIAEQVAVERSRLGAADGLTVQVEQGATGIASGERRPVDAGFEGHAE